MQAVCDLQMLSQRPPLTEGVQSILRLVCGESAVPIINRARRPVAVVVASSLGVPATVVTTRT